MISTHQRTSLHRHLESIIGDNYSPSHVLVHTFGDVTQAMFRDKIEPDANGLYWGDPQKVHLKSKCSELPVPHIIIVQGAAGGAAQDRVPSGRRQRSMACMIFGATRAPLLALVLDAVGRRTGVAAIESCTVGVLHLLGPQCGSETWVVERNG